MSINNTPTIEPRQVTGIFTNYIAKTLPLAFDDSMSYYECLCALLKYINDTIVPDINNVNSGLGELQEFYEELQSYVNNYFDSHDFQEMVNNKLDEMVEDGTLESLIENTLNIVKSYNTYTELIADKDNFVNGLKLKTLGYSTIGDSGAGEYYVTDTSTSNFQVDLENGLYLVLIDSYEMNIKQFGAVGDGVTDDTDSIQAALDYCFTKGIDLKVPATTNYYKITRPLVLQTQTADMIDGYWAGNGSRLFGEYKTRCKIIKIGNTTSGIQDYDVNAVIICKNNTGTGINIENLSLCNYANTSLNTYDNDSYGLYTKCSRSNYKDLNINAYHGIYGSCFSCNFENIVFICINTALEIANGTSNTIRFIYAPNCNNPYKISSSYSTLMNCASDNCTGSIYRLSGLGLTLLNCGCESKHAQYIIEQLDTTWFNVTIQGMMIDRQIGDSDNDISINDCAICHFITEGILNLRDITIVERDRIEEGNSYIFKLDVDSVKISTNIDNLAYYKNYSGTNNTRIKLWNGYHTYANTPHRFNTGGMSFNYVLVGEGKVVPMIGAWNPAQAGSISPEGVIDENITKKGIYLDCTGRYSISGDNNIQYYSRPNLGDIHIFNDPLSYNSLGNCVTSITSNSNYNVTKIPLVIAKETTARPTTNLYTGLCIFDTTLNKPIWYDGSNWRDASGTQV